jgi:hypothetical protein
MFRQTCRITPKKLVSDFIFKDECYAIIVPSEMRLGAVTHNLSLSFADSCHP